MKIIESTSSISFQSNEVRLNYLNAIRIRIAELFGDGTISESDFEKLNSKISECTNQLFGNGGLNK